jgi:hypothetical protein
LNDEPKINKKDKIFIVIDRLVVKDYSLEDNLDLKRLKDSLTLAFKIS